MKIVLLATLLILTPCITNAGISHESKIALKLHKYEKALKLLKAQAVRDNADAQYHLGLLYRTGKGTKQNYKNALYWFKRSAKNGNIRAQYSCGVLFENGYGVKPNQAKALRWYKMAAKKGHEKSKLKIKQSSDTKNKGLSNSHEQLFIKIKNKKNVTVKNILKNCKNINVKTRMVIPP